MRLWKLTMNIFEPSIGFDYPVVQHSFFGKTQEEAEGYYQAHLTTDTFLRGCVTKRKWKQIDCETDVYWELIR